MIKKRVWTFIEKANLEIESQSALMAYLLVRLNCDAAAKDAEARASGTRAGCVTARPAPLSNL